MFKCYYVPFGQAISNSYLTLRSLLKYLNPIPQLGNLTQIRLIIFLGITGYGISIQAQNLIPNPSFENQIDCPYQFHDTVAVPWRHGTDGTSDHFHTCANPNFCGIPVNFFGNQIARTGSAYGGANLRGHNEYREYLMVELLSPLVAGKMYYLSFYTSLADNGCGIIPFGAYLTQSPPPYVPGEYVLDLSTQYEHNGGYLSDKISWTHMEGCILAAGGEKWILFGNFSPYGGSPIDPDCEIAGNIRSYYYLDDASLSLTIPDEEFDAQIGGPFADCFVVTVEPDIPGTFYWSDGTVGPTFTTNQSGIYSFSVVDSCRLGTGTFEVIVLGNPVDLGSHNAQVCEGDELTITLPEEFGNFIWNTGSTENFIEITEPGYYTVTVDDGCNISDDGVVVTFVEPLPDPILDDDTHICNGEALEIDLSDFPATFLWQDGSSENTYAIENEGTYSVTVTNACGQVTDEIEVIEIVEPEVQLGPDTLLCENSIIEFFLDPDQGEYVWHDGDDSPHYVISEPGTYTVFVTNVCGSQSDQINVTLVPALSLDLDQSILLCPAQLPYPINATTLGGNHYLWNTGDTLSTLQINSAGTYIVTITNECFLVTDSIHITVTDIPPLAQLPEDTTLCKGETIVLTNSGANGAYLWQDQSTQDTLLVSAEGNYSLTVTNICGAGSDTINVQYQPVLTVDLGPDFSLCSGESFVLHTNNAGIQYIWQDMSAADSFVVSTPGVYHVTVSNQCESARDTVIVTLNNNPPDVDLPAELNLCQGEVISLESGISGVAYLWNDGSKNPSIEISSPGSYSLTVSSNCGSDVDSVIVNDAGPQPEIELGNNLDLCEGENIVITPAFSNVDSWLWQDGSNSPSIEINVGGEISIQATNFCGTVYDTLDVTQLPAIPPLSLGNDTSYCPGNPVVLSINIPDVDITWSDGTNGNSIIAHASGSYHAMIANSCGNSVDTIAIALLPDAPVVNLGIDQKICPNEQIVFDPGVSDVDYLWQDGSTATTFTATTPGEIILYVSNACGMDADTVLIIENTEGPQVNLGPDIIGCVGDEVTINADVLGVDYLWQDGSNSSSYTTSSSSTLVLTISNNCGDDTDTIEIDLSAVKPDVDLGIDTTICSGNTLVLQYLSSDGAALIWQDGSTSSSHEVTSAGIYSLTATNFCGGDSDSVYVDIAFVPEPFSLGPDTILCAGESIELIAPATNDVIRWQDGSNLPMITAEEEGVFTLEISNQCGSVTDAINIGINNDVPAVQLEDEIILCPGEKILLDAGQTFPSDYLWSTGENTAAITIVTTGTYAVSVFNDCFTTYDEIVVVDEGCIPHIFIPNVFSPNGDGINDDFAISYSDNITVLEIQGNIYDRWGDIVLSSTDIPFSWNGYFNHRPLNPAVFRYRIQVKYMLRGIEHEEVLVGDVTLLR